MPTFLWPIAPIYLAVGHQPFPLSYVFLHYFWAFWGLSRLYLWTVFSQPLFNAVCCLVNEDPTAGALAWLLLSRSWEIPMTLETHYLSLVSPKIPQENSPSSFCLQPLGTGLRANSMLSCSFHLFTSAWLQVPFLKTKRSLGLLGGQLDT